MVKYFFRAKRTSISIHLGPFLSSGWLTLPKRPSNTKITKHDRNNIEQNMSNKKNGNPRKNNKNKKHQNHQNTQFQPTAHPLPTHSTSKPPANPVLHSPAVSGRGEEWREMRLPRLGEREEMEGSCNTESDRTQGVANCGSYQWEFQDPKMERYLPSIRPM